MSISEDKWRSECIFNVAEYTFTLRSPQAISNGRDLCLLTGKYVTNCIEHQVSTAIHNVRKSHAAQTDSFWLESARTGEALREAWATLNADFSTQVMEQYWAILVDLAMRDMDGGYGDPLDYLPPAATPHVRASAATFVVKSMEGGALVSLNDMVIKTKAALASRRPTAARITASRASAEVPARRVGNKSRLPEDLKKIVYRNNSSRPVSPKEDVDLALCIIEAAHRVRPATPSAQALISGAQSHSDTLLRWAAGGSISPVQATE
jgi:hypothetical protein